MKYPNLEKWAPLPEVPHWISGELLQKADEAFEENGPFIRSSAIPSKDQPAFEFHLGYSYIRQVGYNAGRYPGRPTWLFGNDAPHTGAGSWWAD